MLEMKLELIFQAKSLIYLISHIAVFDYDNHKNSVNKMKSWFFFRDDRVKWKNL